MAERTRILSDNTIEDTSRVEIFSDAVYAIVATLLILELKVPVVTVTSSANFLHALKGLLPEFVAFAFSFLIIMIYWVNHLYLFHHLQKVNWRLIWYNNFHLFWIATIPFTTAFIGRYHLSTIPVVLYGLDMAMTALSILFVAHYASFKANLLYPGLPEQKLRSEFNRAKAGPILYVLATAAAFINVYIPLVIFIVTPILFVAPRLISGRE